MTDRVTFFAANIRHMTPTKDPVAEDRLQFAKALCIVVGEIMAEKQLAGATDFMTPDQAHERGIIAATAAGEEICNAFFDRVRRAMAN
jgi:hypothetical protein